MMAPSILLTPRTLLTLAFPVVAIAVGCWVYWDARGRGRELAPLLGFAVGCLFLAGSVPGLVAFAIESETAIQGFPTAIRIVPGTVALVVYLRFR